MRLPAADDADLERLCGKLPDCKTPSDVIRKCISSVLGALRNTQPHLFNDKENI